ncbi:MAG: glycosyltransferase family 4 protein, partial [Kiritimatiellae bacterium]|nr:glycosyltransferase family 4 protein [Kiritimatiellia bacterium]
MKILFFCWEYPPEGAGIGRYIAEMSAALQSAGHEIIVVTSEADGAPAQEALPNGVLYRLFKRSQMRDPGLAERVAKLAREHRVDWIEGADHWGECVALLARTDRPPVVVKMHYNDVVKRLRYAQAHYGWQRALIDLACLRQWRSIHAERYSLAHADVLTACSQRILDEARDQGVPLCAHVAVLPNPIRPLAQWDNSPAMVPTLLFVGRLDFGKGIAHLRPLIESLVEHIPDVVLEVAGGDSYARGVGSLRSWFERDMAGLREHVRFLGPLTPEALDDAYRRAWVVVAPSIWDTFPQVLLEAMVRAKPVVTSPHGGMAEMVAGTGCPVHDPADKAFAFSVRRLLEDTGARDTLGSALQVRAHAAYAPA